MNKALNQQLNHIEKQEQKILSPPKNSVIKTKLTPIVNNIQGVIPDQLTTTLETAFYKGFQLVFEKGTSLIEKTYNKEKLELDYDLNSYAVSKKPSMKYLRKIEKQSRQSSFLNSSFSVLEGGLLGFLGIGLPDIPLFISVTLKTLYEIALSYGYSYDTDEEKAYLLLLICGAITTGEPQKAFHLELEQLSDKIDHNLVTDINLDKQIRTTSDVLSNALLTAKFIQGIPIVGMIGGAANYNILNKVGKYAGIKYHKRYLLSKVVESHDGI
ncbi:MAG: EcsC family protein [Mobilitalea sp.]